MRFRRNTQNSFLRVCDEFRGRNSFVRRGECNTPKNFKGIFEGIYVYVLLIFCFIIVYALCAFKYFYAYCEHLINCRTIHYF